MEAHTEKQEHQTVHMGTPSPGMDKGSHSAATEWRLSTIGPALTPVIPNFPETYDCFWELLLPITQLS